MIRTLFARVTDGIKWIGASEYLGEDLPPKTVPRERTSVLRYVLSRESLGEEPSREAVAVAPSVPRRRLVRWLLSSETLPLDPASETTGGPLQGLFEYIVGRETLGEEPPAGGTEPGTLTPGREFFEWLMSGEDLPEDEPSGAAVRPRTSIVRYILSREHLDNGTERDGEAGPVDV